MVTRCKFRCVEVTKGCSWRGAPAEFLYAAKFRAVTDESEENRKFWAATPAGSLEVSTIREDVFEVGKEYFLDISAA